LFHTAGMAFLTFSLASDLQPINNANHSSDEPMDLSEFRIQPPEMGSVHHRGSESGSTCPESSPIYTL
jgi:hypothetical protein